VLEASDGVGGRVRTDSVDGFLLDRGFQVFNTAYPAAARLLDYQRLNLQPFHKGVEVHHDGGSARLVDPRRGLRDFAEVTTNRLMPWWDKVALAFFSLYCGYAPVPRLLAGPDRPAAEVLRRAGIGEAAVESLLRPFLSGVLLDPPLSTSGHFLKLVWRSFVRGQVAVPAAGMGAVPRQLADGLPKGTVRLGARVTTLTRRGVGVEGGTEIAADDVVVATDGAVAADLVPTLTPPQWRSVTTFYHSAPPGPEAEQLVHLDPASGLIANSVVMTAVAPSYGSGGRALISSSVVGLEQERPQLERSVRLRLSELYGTSPGELHQIAVYRVERAQPALPAPATLRQPVRLAPGRYVCGDWRDTPSIQGALASGWRAARAVLAGR
jgi:phytoene dehydrogenase-like protein